VPARRDAEATKAARHLLARHAHAGITLKAVAERAGVSPPLILKYFRNKDALFARVMSFETDADALLDAPLDALGRHMVRHVLVSRRERGADPILRTAFAPCTADRATSCAPTSAPRSPNASPPAAPT
jgi:AcrR family transcriptional regulator